MTIFWNVQYLNAGQNIQLTILSKHSVCFCIEISSSNSLFYIKLSNIQDIH